LLVILAIGCGVHDEASPAQSQKRLDLAKDFLVKHELEAADNECNKAIALNKTNDEAYVVRGLVSMVRALDTQRTMEIENCLTGVDRDATVKDLDVFLEKADQDFERATKVTPDYGEAWANRGVTHNLLDDYGAAADYLTKALENRRGSPTRPSRELISGGRSSISRSTWRQPRSCARRCSSPRRCASQTIGLRGFTSLVRNGKKRLNCSRRRPMTRRAGPRKPATT